MLIVCSTSEKNAILCSYRMPIMFHVNFYLQRVVDIFQGLEGEFKFNLKNYIPNAEFLIIL